MIRIKMLNKNWVISIENEKWEFETTKEMKDTLDKLIILKNEYGYTYNENEREQDRRN